jgi:hydrogenase maturation factor
MCLGIPAQLVDGDTGHPDLATVDMGGVLDLVNHRVEHPGTVAVLG